MLLACNLLRANDRAAAKAAKEQEKKVKKQDRSSLGTEPSQAHAHAPQGSMPQNSVEDTLLPGGNKMPPEPSPLGNGLIPDEHMTGILLGCTLELISMLHLAGSVTFSSI